MQMSLLDLEVASVGEDPTLRGKLLQSLGLAMEKALSTVVVDCECPPDTSEESCCCILN